MSIEFSNDPDGLVRTTGLVAPTSDYTACWWSSIGVLPSSSNFGTEFYYGDDPAAFYVDYIWIGINDAGQITISIPGAPSVLYTLGLGTHHWAYTRTGNIHRLYIDGVQRLSITQSVSIFPVTHMYLGTDTITGDWIDHKAKEFREWNAALSTIEITAERASATVVRTAGLITDTPLISDLLDISGNGNDWVESGASMSFTQDPLNNTIETAIDLVALPSNRSDNAHNGGTTFDLWYKYTALTSEVVIGVFGFGDLSVYRPTNFVWIGPISSPSLYLGGFLVTQNRPLQIPVTGGVTYWFQFEPNFGDPTPAILLLDALTANKQSIPSGALIVPDDTPDFPLAIVSINPGDVLNFVKPFPNGEGAASLDNGYMLFEDFGNNNLKTYDNDFNLDKTLSISNGFVRINSNKTQGTFLAANQDNPVTVYQINGSGVQTNSFSLTPSNTILSLTSNLAETIMYWAEATAGADIQSWDMVLGSALPNLASGIIGHFISDMWTLKDGTIIASFVRQSTDTFLVRRYNTSGTQLNQYDLGSPNFPSGTFPRITPAPDDPNSFWAWSHNDDGTSTFRRVQVSDGTILDTVIAVEYELGAYTGVETATPPKRFGISYSCPFITKPPSTTSSNTDGTLLIGASSTIGGLYKLVPNKTNDTLWVTFSPPITEDVMIP